MLKFGIAQIKNIILQCKNPSCNHEHTFAADSPMTTLVSCAECGKHLGFFPALKYEGTSNAQVYEVFFLQVLPELIKTEAIAEPSRSSVPFRILFEFDEPSA